MKRLNLILVVLGFFCGVLYAYADEEIDLSRIVVTPSRIEEQIGSVSGSVIVINSKRSKIITAIQ